MNLYRFLHSSASFLNVNKSALSKLRKKTGYTFSNCRKALELHENDVAMAEKWLHEQAQSLGWSKAMKLEGRPTAQGLIGVLVNKNKASMIELNCETDFVAKNNKFISIMDLIASTSLQVPVPQSANQVSKVYLNSEELKELKAEDGKPLADHLALLIGSVGENVSVRRAVCLSVADGITLTGYTHPTPVNTVGTYVGKYGSLVAYAKQSNIDNIQNGDIGKQLCQHVIGMNPLRIGSSEDEPVENADDEVVMLNQEFLLDPSITIGELLKDSCVEIIDIHRFECGEILEESSACVEKQVLADTV